MEPGIAIPILPARDLAETREFYEREFALVDPNGNLVRIGVPTRG